MQSTTPIYARDQPLPFQKPSCKRCGNNCTSSAALLQGAEKLREDFWKENHSARRSFLMGLMSLTPIHRVRKRVLATEKDGKLPASHDRQVTVTYRLPTPEGHVKVCRKTFAGVLGIANNSLGCLINKKKAGYSVWKDARGQNRRSHAHKYKYDKEDRDLIKALVQSFLLEDSASYCHSSQLYLSSDLNVHKLYRAYKVKHPERRMSDKHFHKIFKEEFPNLKFDLPRSNGCMTCDMWKRKIAAAKDCDKLGFVKKLELHELKMEKTKQMLDNDCSQSQMPGSTVCTVNVGVQQVMFTPSQTCPNTSRQLLNYNLCIHVGDTGTSYMCIWHESIAGQSGNEVPSCIFKVLKSEFTHKRHIKIWCDNCADQGNSYMILMALIYLVAKGYFETIELKFFVSGHSYRSCNQDLKIIEKQVCKQLCKPPTSSELADAIRKCKFSNRELNVVEMASQDFLDFFSVTDHFLNAPQMNINTLSWIKITKNGLPYIRVRPSFNEDNAWRHFRISDQNSSLNDLLNLQDLPRIIETPTITNVKEKEMKMEISLGDYIDEQYKDL